MFHQGLSEKSFGLYKLFIYKGRPNCYKSSKNMENYFPKIFFLKFWKQRKYSWDDMIDGDIFYISKIEFHTLPILGVSRVNISGKF